MLVEILPNLTILYNRHKSGLPIDVKLWKKANDELQILIELLEITL